MRAARIIYRYLTALFLADVLLQFFLAGAGGHRGHRRHADLPRLAGGPRPAS
jgi:hypothetical protein